MPALSVSIDCVTDGELVARAREGDQAAFGELVDRHRTAVCRAAAAALRSRAEADDAAQDTFVVAWQRLASFRGEASFRTWLLTIAWHQAINRRRSVMKWWKRTVALEDDEVGQKSLVGSGFSRTFSERPDAIVEADELRQQIATAIRALSPKLRDALLLAQSGEYTYEEIGTMVKAPVGTIKWRVSEARRLVKKQMRKAGHVELG